MAPVDHLVLLKVKPGTPVDKSETFIAALRDLASLDSVMELYTGGAIGESPYGWTHGLYGRYASKDALHSYIVSKEHQDALDIHGNAILEDICVLDWEGDADSPAAGALAGGVGAIHGVVFKLKDGVDASRGEAMVEAFRAHAGKVPGVHRVTVGKSFADHVTKGFTWGFVATLGGEADLAALKEHPHHVAAMKETVLPIWGEHEFLDFSAKV